VKKSIAAATSNKQNMMNFYARLLPGSRPRGGVVVVVVVVGNNSKKRRKERRRRRRMKDEGAHKMRLKQFETI
jgi:hypothetical protein